MDVKIEARGDWGWVICLGHRASNSEKQVKFSLPPFIPSLLTATKGSFASKRWCGGQLGKKAQARRVLSDDSCLPQTRAQAEGGGRLILPLSTSSQDRKATVLTQGSHSQGRVTSTVLVSLDHSHLHCILEIKMSLFHILYFIWSSHIPITSLPSSAQLQQSCQR